MNVMKSYGDSKCFFKNMHILIGHFKKNFPSQFKTKTEFLKLMF